MGISNFIPNPYEEGYINGYQDAARQIFKSIESKLMVATNIEDFDGYVKMWLDDFCKLKDKYTEGTE